MDELEAAAAVEAISMWRSTVGVLTAAFSWKGSRVSTSAGSKVNGLRVEAVCLPVQQTQAAMSADTFGSHRRGMAGATSVPMAGTWGLHGEQDARVTRVARAPRINNL